VDIVFDSGLKLKAKHSQEIQDSIGEDRNMQETIYRAFEEISLQLSIGFPCRIL